MVDALDLWARSVHTEPCYAGRTIEGWPLVFSTQIRFTDIDLLGHVNNVTYGTYFEEARMNFLRWLWGKTGVDPSIIVAHLDMDFRQPLYLHDEPVIAVCVGETGRSRFELRYRLMTDKTVCEGRTINIWYDYATARSSPIPTKIREAIAGLQAR